MVLSVVVYRCESWTIQNTKELMLSNCVVLAKTLENPLECQEIKPVNPRWNQPWILTGRTDVKADAPILWPPDGKSWLIRNDSDGGKDWGEGDKRRRDGWMASLTQWTSVWAGSGRPGVLWSMGPQRVGHAWATEQQQRQWVLTPHPTQTQSTSPLHLSALQPTPATATLSLQTLV